MKMNQLNCANYQGLTQLNLEQQESMEKGTKILRSKCDLPKSGTKNPNQELGIFEIFDPNAKLNTRFCRE